MIKWSYKFSVGDLEIDEQHKKLIDIISQAEALIKKNDKQFIDIFNIVTELDAYVETHLIYEEALMRKTNYQDSQAHIKEHNELRKKMISTNIIEIEDAGKFYMDTLVYLVQWLSHHIMSTDKKLGMFLATKK
jgi:hemerythrin